MKTRTNIKSVQQNRNASIRTRSDRAGKLRTETCRRDDDSISIAVSTDPLNDTTHLYVNFQNQNFIRFNGRQARTLYRLLQKHYRETNKSF